MRAFLADHWAVVALWLCFTSAIDFALLGGALGGTLAMQVFRHKTRHWYFRFGFPLLTVLQIALLLWLALG